MSLMQTVRLMSSDCHAAHWREGHAVSSVRTNGTHETGHERTFPNSPIRRDWLGGTAMIGWLEKLGWDRYGDG
jgi:hypothetical protein